MCMALLSESGGTSFATHVSATAALIVAAVSAEGAAQPLGFAGAEPGGTFTRYSSEDIEGIVPAVGEAD